MRRFTLLFLLAVFSTAAVSQNTACQDDFNYLVNKIKNDYPGYGDKVTPETRKDLFALEARLREKIARHPDSCGKYLDEYASWFRDYHLFVRKNRSKNLVVDDRALPEPRILELNDDTLKALSRKTGSIEGLWMSFWGKVAIVKSSAQTCTGVAVQYSGYKPGQVIFEFTPPDGKELTLDYFPEYDDFRPVHAKATLHMDDRILEIHDFFKLVRLTGSAAYDNAFLASYQAQYPNGRNIYPLSLYLGDSTYYLRITSFGDDQAGRFVKAHRSEIMARPNLIIDIRYNGGGQDEFYEPLSELIYTNPYVSKCVGYYASEGNIRSMEEAIKTGDIKDGEDNLRWTEELIGEMKKHPGGFVVHPRYQGDTICKMDTVYPYPRRVGIIINEGNGSSAEQFLLGAKESRKVLLFGNRNTAGVLDYSNRVPETFPSGRYTLYFPLTRSLRLPEHPIDNIGIAPDVIIPFPVTEQLYDRLDDWVYFVRDYLESPDCGIRWPGN